jgi:serine/threonine protein kinase
VSELQSPNGCGRDLPRVSFAGNSTDAIARPSADSPSNQEIISEIIAKLIVSRARGESISNEQVIAAHPELMPDLLEELLGVGELHRAITLAQVKGASVSPIDSSDEVDPANREGPEGVPGESNPHRGLRLKGYLIEREISSGGQATVFKAVQERTGRPVAVKLMHGGQYMGARSRTRFERESVILARLNHPNVVTILDRGRTDDGSFFLVMDYIDGANLDCYVRELGQNTEAIVRLFVKIANAIDEAHRHGIVHRDLKPMNILVDCRGEPHILDFGMARLLPEDGCGGGDINQNVLTRTGQVLGTLPWSSPEQVSNSADPVDARSDVYVLGLLLFSSLTGRFPYPVDGNLGSITYHIAKTPPASPMRLAQRHGIKVLSPLEDVILKALSKSPSQRYGSAGLMARDLEASLTRNPRSLRRFVSRKLSVFLLFGLMAYVALLSFDSISATKSVPSFTNSIGMLFVRVPPDGNTMATLPEEHHEITYHQESTSLGLGAFYMSATVVTQEQFHSVTGRYPPHPNGPDFPIQSVTWDDATTFCNVLSKRDNRKYRLPTPAEWKFARRVGGSSTLNQNTLDTAAWYAGNSGSQLHEVAKKSPDRSGLYDMIGNVRQWCSISARPIANSKISADPKDHPAQPVEGTDYKASAPECLLPSELELPPSTSRPTIGFRVVCESVGPK